MAESTQSKHPWRASVRTGLNTALLVLAALAVGMPEIVAFVREQWPESPAVGIVTGASAVVVGLSVLVNRVLLLPAVTDLLEAIGLGPTPKDSDEVVIEAPADVDADTLQEHINDLAAQGYDRAQIRKLIDSE